MGLCCFRLIVLVSQRRVVVQRGDEASTRSRLRTTLSATMWVSRCLSVRLGSLRGTRAVNCPVTPSEKPISLQSTAKRSVSSSKNDIWPTPSTGLVLSVLSGTGRTVSRFSLRVDSEWVSEWVALHPTELRSFRRKKLIVTYDLWLYAVQPVMLWTGAAVKVCCRS